MRRTTQSLNLTLHFPLSLLSCRGLLLFYQSHEAAALTSAHTVARKDMLETAATYDASHCRGTTPWNNGLPLSQDR
jgi:hypothetical protein